ncbi:MAG: hypothetical protein ABR511_04065 [Acidimicrobiales bacterium]
MPTAAYLETGTKKVFAVALDWPGWARAAKTEDAALEALAAYAARYAPVPAAAGVRFPANAAASIDVVARVEGDGSTDFGVLGAVLDDDHQPLTAARARRQASLVEATWRVFDEVVAAAPASLRKGPRGGGRDRDAIVEHVVNAEAVYARKLGLKRRAPDPTDAGAVAQARRALLDVLAGGTPPDPPAGKGWPVAYGARRVAWHVLDHTWEIEDRTER